MMKITHSRTALMLVSLMITGACLADPVVDAMQEARERYDAGDLDGSVGALESAASRIHGQRDSSLLDILPEPLAGWRADPPLLRSNPLRESIVGQDVSRRYFRDDGAQIKLSLWIDSPAFPIISGATLRPLKPDESSDKAAFNLGQWPGRIDRPGPGTIGITLVAGTRLIVHIRGFGIADEEPLLDYLQALDIDNVLASLK
jgi:hypothetical protein